MAATAITSWSLSGASEKLSQAIVPERVRRPVDAIRTLWATGAFRDPKTLMTQFRHRSSVKRMTRALFYHRYATATLLGVEAGVYDALATGPMNHRELAEACDINPRGADALLRILESQGAVIRDGSRFKLSEFAAEFLAHGGPASVADTLELMAAQAAAFGDLREGLRTGEVSSELNIFSDSGRHNAFLNAVNSYLHWAAPELLRRVELPEIRSFIAGSMGVSFSAHVLQRFPDAKVTFGCLDHLVKEIPRLRETYKVPPGAVTGMHAHGGDPSQDKWGDENYDLVLLTKKMILEPDQRIGEKFAAKAFDVLRPGGVAVLWETVHTDSGPTPLARAMEAVMDLVTAPSGLVNTESDLRRTLGNIGFSKIEIVPCLGNQTSFVVARKSA